MEWTLPLLAIVAGTLVLRSVRGRRRVRKWAEENGLVVVERKNPWLRSNPFPMTPFNKRPLHYLVVRERDGRLRRCWLSTSANPFAPLSSRVDVVWE